MNPVFWFLVFLAAVVLWLAISFIFIPLGGLLLKLVKRIFNIINYEENDSESEEEARLKHGWVTVQGADATVVDASEK